MEKNVLSQFINNIPQYMWWKDLDSNFLGCNDNFIEYAGLENENQLIGKTDYDYWNEEDADSFRKVDNEIIKTGQSIFNQVEYVNVPHKGKRWLSTSKVPLYNDEKEIIGTIGWFNDITEFKQMQTKVSKKTKALIDNSSQLEQANKELEIANIDLEKFTYAASHDLKEPIRTLKNFATLLKEKEKNNLDQESTMYIDFISKSAKRMGILIDDILNYARTGISGLKAEHIDINELVSTKIIDLKQIIETKSAIININLPTEKINCYPHLIGLVFYNLINNGIKFNESPTPIINCDYTEEDDYWIFSVEDNGIGIHPENAKKIFEPFKRFVGGSYEGSGMGLSICKRVTNLHEGNIWVAESASGSTIFKFSISKNI